MLAIFYMNYFDWTMKKFRDSFTLVDAVRGNLLISLTKPWSHPGRAGHYALTTINLDLFQFMFTVPYSLWMSFDEEFNDREKMSSWHITRLQVKKKGLWYDPVHCTMWLSFSKNGIRDSNQIFTTAPIFLQFNYFRQNLEDNVTFYF